MAFSFAQTTLKMGEYYANNYVAGADPTNTEQFIGNASWANDASQSYFEFYLPIGGLGTFTIADIDYISYVTKKPAAQDQVDFFIKIYTPPYPGGDASWYGNRLNTEPLYSNNLNAPANTWNTWSTVSGNNQLTFNDHNHGPAGFYNGPTLADVQAGPITWSAYVAGGDVNPIDYASQDVLYIAFGTGTAWNSIFNGYLDAIVIALKNGSSITFDLEIDVSETWVDDDYTGTNPGETVDGHVFGNDAFDTINGALAVVSAGGTVNVEAGTYDELVSITKAVTLRGANWGVHPVVGTHPTETVGSRGAESILSHNGLYAFSPQADNITIDGFKFTGNGGRVIDTYSNANNFHLTNCIFDNPVAHGQTGNIQFGGGSHTDMLVDFNLFYDEGDHTFYFGGGPYDRLNLAYNKFNGVGEGVFWAATALLMQLLKVMNLTELLAELPGRAVPA